MTQMKYLYFFVFLPIEHIKYYRRPLKTKPLAYEGMKIKPPSIVSEKTHEIIQGELC
jgi:hypothetical protein